MVKNYVYFELCVWGGGMTTLRHLGCLILFLGGLCAQPAQKVGPDCGPYFFTASASGVISGAAGRIDNLFNGAQCFSWTVSYSSTGFSGVSAALQSTVDNGGVPYAPGWGSFAGTVLSGTNPLTSTTSASATFLGYYPWLRINVTSVTGSGLISGQVYGYSFRSGGSNIAQSATYHSWAALTLSSWQALTLPVWQSMTP